MTEESTDGTNRPSKCQNPDADCHREPTKMVAWSEDYTADDPHWSGWLCTPCWVMVKMGTKLSPNEVEVRRYVDTGGDS